MTPFLKKAITVLTCAVLSAVFIVAMVFGAPKIEDVPETTGKKITEYIRVGDKQYEPVEFTAGEDFVAVAIEDIVETGRLTKVNYVADKFTQANHLDPAMQIVDLTKPFDFAEKGSLIFVFCNLDPFDEAFFDKSERLAPFMIGDYWCFNVSLPEIFCASNVYNVNQLVARNGEIADYNFGDFGVYYGKTEKLSAQTKTTDVSLQFRVKQGLDLSYKMITIHYQSTGSAYAGLKDCPLVGTENAVQSLNDHSKNYLSILGILAAVVFAVLVVLAFVEQSKTFISAIVWIFGIAIQLLSRFFLNGATGAPLWWSGLVLAAPFIILGGAQLSVMGRVGKFSAKYFTPPPALSALGAILAFLRPFVPFGTAGALGIVCLVVKSIGVAALTAVIALNVLRKGDRHGILQTVCAGLIDVAIFASLFLPQAFPVQVDPLYWLCALITAATFVSVVAVITDMKKDNVYLTQNLHKEVERQVKDIKSVIDERDKLLQFVSHDMKKPLASAVMLCDTAIEREKDGEQVKTLGIIKQDAQRVIDGLSEVAAYAKLNYLSEPSQVVDLCALCALLFKYHKFDCDANGIILKNMADAHVKAFVKPKGIENVVSNIIINAIEHANCSTITLSVKAEKNKVVLSIADDGKGIDEGLDVFKPYVSENRTETGGLGLYICKNIIESMNGELSYRSGAGGTVFYITLLKA